MEDVMPKKVQAGKPQLSNQRYIKHLAAAGKIIFFDRSWYNRARHG